MENKRLIIILSVAGALLFVPLVAMQFTNEVDWSAADFTIMGILLLSTGLACEFVLRKVNASKYRIAWCVGIVSAFLLVWAELAVGIFGTSFGGS